MAIYFIIWITVLYYVIFLLKLFQLWPLSTLSGWVLGPFYRLPSLCFFEYFLCHMMLQAHLIYSLPQP